jgi:hypothetical protein
LTSWDVVKTYGHVRRIFGREQEILAKESLRSVTDRQFFSSYHFGEAMRLSEIFERDHLKGKVTLLELHVVGAEDGQKAFETYMLQAGAHSLAAVQSLHAIPDIFAHAVFFSTGQNLKSHPLSEDNLSLPKVAGCLINDDKFKTLSTPLQLIQSGIGWQHLAAVSNMSKHRSVVRTAYNEDWTGTKEKIRELYISSFCRKNISYPTVSLRNLLEPEYKRLMNAIISIGNKMNSHLSLM